MDVPRELTVGVMAEKLGVAIHRVQWILKTRGIRERSKAGILRVYDHAAFERVKKELAMPRRRAS